MKVTTSPTTSRAPSRRPLARRSAWLTSEPPFAGGPNRPGVSARLDGTTLKITAWQTLIGGEGFGYSLATFPRKGVKTVNGMKLP